MIISHQREDVVVSVRLVKRRWAENRQVGVYFRMRVWVWMREAQSRWRAAFYVDKPQTICWSAICVWGACTGKADRLDCLVKHTAMGNSA